MLVLNTITYTSSTISHTLVLVLPSHTQMAHFTFLNLILLIPIVVQGLLFGSCFAYLTLKAAEQKHGVSQMATDICRIPDGLKLP